MKKFKEFFKTKIGMKDYADAIKVANVLGAPAGEAVPVKSPSSVATPGADVNVSAGVTAQTPGIG